MNNGSIATRYSRALFEEALKEQADGLIYDYLGMLYDTLKAVPEVQDALISPRISNEQKFRLLLIGSGLETDTKNLKQIVSRLFALFRGEEKSSVVENLKQEIKDKGLIDGVKESVKDAIQNKDAQNLYKRFLWLVLKHEREELTRIIILVYRDLYREHHKIDHVVLTTAVEISKEMEDKVADKVRMKTGREVEMEKVVKPELIGGFSVRIGDRLYDYSYHTRLNNIRRSLWNK